MILVKFPRCFHGYPLTAIPKALLDRLQATSGWTCHIRSTAIRLQAFCELTDRTLVGLKEPDAVALLEDFAAASFSSTFRSHNHRGGAWTTLGFLRSALPETLRFEYPTVANKAGWNEDFRNRVHEFDKMVFDPELTKFWTGWSTRNAAGQWRALKLHRFWSRFGSAKTRDLFEAADGWFSKGRYQNIPCLEAFADYLSTVEEIDFDDSNSIGEAINSFMHLHLHEAHKRGVRLSVLLTNWKQFARLLTDHLLGHAWATPLPAIPTPRAPRIVGATTNLRKTSQGNVVKTTLVTQIPLHVTDTAAKELLFRDIQVESDALLAWARYEVREARFRLERRRTLAPTGIVSVTQPSMKNTGLHYRLSRECPEHLAHAAATYEANGFNHIGSRQAATRIYPKPLHQTSWELGIPSMNLLIAHATVLVGQHPLITPAFLGDLELFDTDGQQVGLVTSDSGWYLRSQKRRRGPRLAQQEVLLTTETLQVVRDVIELTAPLRAWLREKGNPHWKLLFLAASSIGNAPKKWGQDQKIYRRSEWLAERLTTFAAESSLEDDNFAWLSDSVRALELANRFSLKRFRGQQGILVYLKTGSVEQMAKALGHHVWTPKLLDHYLPRPIQEFFVDRWIRLFQTGIICEAMTNSPYLLEATSFSTMEELDAFLEHHALRRLPAHLEDPDHVGGRRTRIPEDRVVFGIEVGILTVLMSLEAAVRTSTRPPCGRAVRWARISERLIPHLEAQTEQPEFYAMVAEARRHTDPRRVEPLIYD